MKINIDTVLAANKRKRGKLLAMSQANYDMYIRYFDEQLTGWRVTRGAHAAMRKLIRIARRSARSEFAIAAAVTRATRLVARGKV